MAHDPSFAAGGLLDRLSRPLRQGDLALALGVIGILVVLILPMPRLLLDLLLAVSITFSVLILLTLAVHREAARVQLLSRRSC